MKLFIKASIFSLMLVFFNCTKDENKTDDEDTSPSISAINPTSGPRDTVITISGVNFGTDVSATQVLFNGVSGTVQTVSETEITATVLSGSSTGVVTVIIDGISADGPVFTYEISERIVSTLAGSTEGFTNGAGDAAQFASPWGIARASNGDLYIADRGNHVIRKVTAGGTTTTFAGSGTAGFADGNGNSAQFDTPYGIDIDNDGNLYVADRENHRIRKITPSGVVSTLAGSGAADYIDDIGIAAAFNTPLDLAVDTNGNVFVSDESNHVIRKITPDGTVTTFAGTGVPGDVDGTAIEARFNQPDGIAVGQDGSVYIGDAFNHKIRKISPTGDVTTLAGSGTPGDMDGTGAAAQFNTPTGLFTDGDGNVYVAGNFTHKIRKVTSNGTVTTFAGSTLGDLDGDVSEATFSRPSDLVIDNNGTFYITERGNHRIRVITQD
jgi:glucose/arabinose dehydrogenase